MSWGAKFGGGVGLKGEYYYFSDTIVTKNTMMCTTGGSLRLLSSVFVKCIKGKKKYQWVGWRLIHMCFGLFSPFGSIFTLQVIISKYALKKKLRNVLFQAIQRNWVCKHDTECTQLVKVSVWMFLETFISLCFVEPLWIIQTEISEEPERVSSWTPY